MPERIPQIIERLTEGEKHMARGDERFDTIEAMLRRIEGNQNRVNEIVEAWDNAKGFIATMKWLLKAAGVCAAVLGFLYAIYHFGKTGTWNPPKLP